MKVVLKLTAVLTILLLAVTGSLLIAGVVDSSAGANLLVRGFLIILVFGVASAIIALIIGKKDSSQKSEEMNL